MIELFDGQEIWINGSDVVLSVKEPFYSAGKHFGWEWKGLGVGVNRKIIAFVLNTRRDLVIKLDTDNKFYRVNNSSLREYIAKFDYNYSVGDTVVLKVLPWNLLEGEKL